MLPALKSFLPLAEKIYNKKTSLDILQYLCVTNGNIIYTDLETFITMPVTDKRSFTVPISILKKVISTKPHSLHIDIPDKNKLSVSYDNKQITFPVASVEEYPSPVKEDFKDKGTWSAEVLHKLYKQIPYASTDLLRPALTGVFIQQNKTKLTSVATDGHVLQYITGMKVKAKSKSESIVPVTPIKLVSRFNRGDVKVFTSEHHIRFTFNNGIEVTSRLIKESYPDFKRVIPELNGNEIILEKKEILDSIKSALPFSNINNHQAVFKSNNGHIQIRVNDSEEETNYESSFAIKNKKGRELHMALNLELLEKTVKGMEEDQLHWYYNSPDDPSIFTNDNGVQNLIMPIRLKEEA